MSYKQHYNINKGFTVRLADFHKDHIKARCEAEGKSISEYIRKLIVNDYRGNK